MQLNAQQVVTQFAHLLQQEMFPKLEQARGRLSKDLELLAAVMALLPLQRLLTARRASTGRPWEDRAASATAFVAKAILNLCTTRDLLSRLPVDEALHELCGWRTVKAIPHESKFSRASAEFAECELPQQWHEAVIAATRKERLIGHIARDSTAIAAREHYPETVKQQKAKAKQGSRKKHPKGCFAKKKASERGTRIQRQRKQKLAQMLNDLPRQCDSGTKKNSKGQEQYWRGYKLHLDVADGQIPISALLSNASVHDSQFAIRLMTMSSQRVTHLYELMDSAYDADEIHAHSRQLNHVPIIEPHSRRGTKKPPQLPKIFPAQPTPQLTWRSAIAIGRAQ